MELEVTVLMGFILQIAKLNCKYTHWKLTDLKDSSYPMCLYLTIQSAVKYAKVILQIIAICFPIWQWCQAVTSTNASLLLSTGHLGTNPREIRTKIWYFYLNEETTYLKVPSAICRPICIDSNVIVHVCNVFPKEIAKMMQPGFWYWIDRWQT